MKRDTRTQNGFQQIRKFFDYTLASEVTKILLVKDHTQNGKESFCAKTIESTYATFAVGHTTDEQKCGLANFRKSL